jgi:hypothetical protein
MSLVLLSFVQEVEVSVGVGVQLAPLLSVA